jgi:two-component system, NarL family, sensor histidine kinase UhpB
MNDQMEKKALRVLMVEDSADDAELILEALRDGGFNADSLRVETEEAMRNALAGGNWDVVLSDYSLPHFSGDGALAVAKELAPDVPFIIVSGLIGEETAVALMKAGAHDFVMKGSAARLVPAVQRGLLEQQTRKQFNLAQIALQKSEARFRAIASNLPGVVYQLVKQADGSMLFPYVSEYSTILFGLNPQALHDNPKLFLNLVVPEDRVSYERSLAASASGLATWNWEGRIKYGGNGEIKWINLRASPREVSPGAVLWDGIMSDITQNKLAEIEVKRSREQLAELTSYLQTVKEQERARIAREIHDDLGGTLTAVKIDLLWLHNRLPKELPDLEGKVDSMDLLVDRAIEATARIASDLRPGILDFGIVAAIEWQAREFQSRTGIRCEAVSRNEEIPLDPDLSVNLFRIFQEALTNITKHAKASRVSVNIGESDGWLELKVSDNGRGITRDDMSKSKSFGIRGMHERVRILGGKIEISGAPRGGTTLSVRIPHAEALRQAAEQHS